MGIVDYIVDGHFIIKDLIMIIEDWKLIDDFTTDGLTKKINVLIAQGYQPRGFVFINSGAGRHLVQTMVKYNKRDKQNRYGGCFKNSITIRFSKWEK